MMNRMMRRNEMHLRRDPYNRAGKNDEQKSPGQLLVPRPAARALKNEGDAMSPIQEAVAITGRASSAVHTLPAYLTSHYWWAYVHPRAIKVFERQWLINLILWGNYSKLSEAVLADLNDYSSGKILQVACAYGDLTNRLVDRFAAAKGRVDVIDVVPAQISNLRRKLDGDESARLMVMDASNIRMPDASYDCALVYFLLHEQPATYREKTLSELCRVVRPGGRIVIVDYHRPNWWNPLRYLWRPLLSSLEPFALDLWRKEIAYWCPKNVAVRKAQNFFGGLYQKVVIDL